MGVGQIVRAVVVCGSVLLAAASATSNKPVTAPQAHDIERSKTIRGSLDVVWTALVDTFAAQDWKIDKLDKPSGIVTTDWMNNNIPNTVDCGSGLDLTRQIVRFNVLVRAAGESTVVTVNTSLRAFDKSGISIDCTSTGTIEQLIHAEIMKRTHAAAASAGDGTGRKTVTGDRPLFCAITAPDIGQCYETEAACTAIAAAGTRCERKDAGSCFSATKILDGTKSTTCAVSIKDCQTRRGAVAADPDYRVTECGIYRAKAAQ